MKKNVLDLFSVGEPHCIRNSCVTEFIGPHLSKRRFLRPNTHFGPYVSARRTSICGLRPANHQVDWKSRHGGGGSGAWFPGAGAAAGTEAAEDRTVSEVPTAHFLATLSIILSMIAACFQQPNLVDDLPNPSRSRCAVLQFWQEIAKVPTLVVGRASGVGWLQV